MPVGLPQGTALHLARADPVAWLVDPVAWLEDPVSRLEDPVARLSDTGSMRGQGGSADTLERSEGEIPGQKCNFAAR